MRVCYATSFEAASALRERRRELVKDGMVMLDVLDEWATLRRVTAADAPVTGEQAQRGARVSAEEGACDAALRTKRETRRRVMDDALYDEYGDDLCMTDVEVLLSLC